MPIGWALFSFDIVCSIVIRFPPNRSKIANLTFYNNSRESAQYQARRLRYTPLQKDMSYRRLCIYLFCILFLAAGAQSKKRTFRQREIGMFAGGIYYLGDINPRTHFLYSQPALGAFFRYTTSYSYAFRFGAN